MRTEMSFYILSQNGLNDVCNIKGESAFAIIFFESTILDGAIRIVNQF